MTDSALIPPIVALPVAGLAMLVAAVHLVVTEQKPGDALRRRIRIANGWVMLLAIPLVAAGFSLIDHDRRPRMFVVVWTTIAGLVTISVLLAAADVVNSVILARRSWRDLNDARARLLRDARRAQAGAADEDHGP
ncbi:MAG: hypothetical protein D6693_10440 [Planctomycetota bacterium]|nr:MAG: hypothetical protein D6693_10440 [Planctomycetota bacterium]